MLNKFFLVALSALLAGLTVGCHRSDQSTSNGYFKTPFQEESQFIVEAIVSDMAEQMFYAKNHQLPDQKRFRVTATENGGTHDAPVYDLVVHLDSKHPDVKMQVNVNGPIWSPEIYQDMAQALAQTIGVSAGSLDNTEDTTMLSRLTDVSAETIEDENESLSSELESDFTNPMLHERAALLLGAFTMREHSGYFFDIRLPLSRITAHLAMANFFSGGKPYGVNGQIANAIMLTLVGDEALALKQLEAVKTNDASAAAFVRVLQAHNTGDWRTLDSASGLSRIENIEWFHMKSDLVGTPQVWQKLSDEQKQTIDFVRIAYEESHSVEMGHQLMAVALPLELQEINSVYKKSKHAQLTKDTIVKALNEMPERCFTTSGRTVHVRVIGWGQWAAFLQRQLCHAIQQDFDMLNYMWDVPDDAKEFSAKSDEAFSGLRLYPFVRRFNCTDEASYHKAVDDGFKVTVETPHLVPAECWNWLCYRVQFAPLYSPNPNPHINEWHNHNPPPGTVYDLNPRLNHPSLIDRGIPAFENLHALAPYDCRIINFILEKQYNKHPTYEQAMDLYSSMLPYSLTAVMTVANAAYKNPDQYEKLMLQAAQLNPVSYYQLGDYYYSHQDEDKAAQYYDKACETDADSVRASNYALLRVKYNLKKGNVEKAQQIAADGAQVYSSVGLEAQAVFFEMTSNYDGAFEWFSKNEERYNDSTPLLNFCMRYKMQTGDSKFDDELQKRTGSLFPTGIKNVKLSDFKNPPMDGVLVKQENDLTKSAGLKQGDVIVAIYGFRMHNFQQYSAAREWRSTPEMDMIVWQGDGYHEIQASPPNHRFGVEFGDYK